METNFNTNTFSFNIQNGSVTLELNSFDYPKLTIVRYEKASSAVGGLVSTELSSDVGKRISCSGLDFYVESVTKDIATLSEGELVNVVTTSYTHVSKLTYEAPLSVMDFVEKNKNEARKTGDSYIFPIGSLISYAKARVNIGTFDVTFSKQPSPDETVTLKSFCDAAALVQGTIAYRFEGSSIGFQFLGLNGNVPWTSTSNVTTNLSTVDTYKDTALTWTKENDSSVVKGKNLIKLQTIKYCLYEGDYKPHIAPPETSDNTKFPRDLSVMIDNAGTTKQFKLTLYEYGQPSVELSGVFGFAHAALELVEDPNKPNIQSEAILDGISDSVISSGNAYQELLSSISSGKYGYPDDANFSNSMVWRCLEVKKTKYIYDAFVPSIIPRLRNSNGLLEPIEVAPSYRQAIYSKVQVLIAKETIGWEIKRFAQEDSKNWTDGSIGSWLQLKGLTELESTLAQGDRESRQLYNLSLYQAKVGLEQYLYRKIPIFERTDYAIETFSKYYKDGDDVNWEVRYIPSKDTSKGGDDEPIPVLFPDPDWTPELLLVAQSRYKSSVGLSGNPDYNPLARNYFGSNPITISTGSEEYEFTKYSVLPSKNTKPSIGDMYKDFTNISDVVTAIENAQSLPGTCYAPHEFMAMNDYGLKGVTVPSVSGGDFSNIYPRNLARTDDVYLTQTTFRNAQDNSYKSFLTNSTYSITQGRPPTATTRKAQFQEEDLESNSSILKDTMTLITVANRPNAAKVIGAVSIPAAKNKEEAIQGAAALLTKSVLESGGSASGILNFTLVKEQGITKFINSRIQIPKARGNWVTKRISLTVQYADGIGFTQQIQFDAGMSYNPTIKSITAPLVSKDESGKSVKIEVTGNLTQTFGTAKDNISSDFSRWVDSN